MMLQHGVFPIILLALQALSTPVRQSLALSARDDLTLNKYVVVGMVTASMSSGPYRLAY